jgi:arylsulfatase A-like enzyme
MDPEVPTLASLLAEHGYRCAGFPGNDLVGTRMGFGKGFDLYFEKYVLVDEEADEQGATSANNRNRWEDVLDAAEGWLGLQKESVFLWLHYLDTHHLPECDLPEYFRFSQDPLWQFYEGKISYADQCCLRSVLDLLIRNGRYEDTLIVVLSDHGEELVRGMPPAHNGLLTEGVLRVPLILFCEQGPWKGLRVPDLVRTADIVPTLLGDLLDLPGDGTKRMDNALAGVLLPLPGLDRGEGYDPRRELAYAENEPLGLSCIRSGHWKYVTGPEGDLLFHVPTDPLERNNVVDRHPGTVEYLKEALTSIRSSRPQVERVRAEREEEETRRLLRSLGYLE